jgi:2-desacetyl-2-hydroxyethyl bacteriochlorophyllide A dehydrogenase
MGQPDTSIVIRTYNEARFLPGLLSAIGRQEYQAAETIVVDSGSVDGTLDIAREHADRVIPIESGDFTFGYSLNVGIRAARGRFIVIVSAHTLPVDDRWLAELVSPLADAQIAMVYGRQLGGRSSNLSETRDMQRVFGTRRRVLKPPRFFANNANSAISKALWDQHPFDETLLGLEDIEWAKYWMERHYQVVYEPRAALYHIHEENAWQVRRRYFREAVAARRIGIKDKRHVVSVPLKEAGRTLMDIGHLFFGGRNSDDTPSSTQRLVSETVKFRYNKTIGTVNGLLNGTDSQEHYRNRNIFFDRSGRAVVIRGVKKAALEMIAIPEVKPGDVLIRVAYEAVCATDLEIYRGTLGYYQNGMASYPIVPGHEFSGKVVAFGPNVNQFAIGDPVVVECIQSCGACKECLRENFIGCPQRAELGVIGLDGGYAEYVRVPGKFVHCLPPDTDMIAACLCEPLAVAIKGIKRLRRTWRQKQRKETQACAVVGAGPLGHLCARVLSLWGHTVTVFDRNAGRLAYFDGSPIAVAQDWARLGEFDHVIEATGDPDALDSILHRSPAGATILLLGLPYAHRNFTFESIVAYDKIIVGSVGSSAKHFQTAIELLPRIDMTAFKSKLLPLAEFKQAWELSASHAHLKVILDAS